MKTILLAILFTTCARHSNNDTKNDIVCFKVTQLFPVLADKETKLLNYDTLIAYVYSYNNQVYINSSYTYSLYEGNEAKHILTEQRFNDFVYTTGNKFGLFFDKHSGKKRILVDSMLRKEWIYGFGRF